jgi:hypothetical protein
VITTPLLIRSDIFLTGMIDPDMVPGKPLQKPLKNFKDKKPSTQGLLGWMLFNSCTSMMSLIGVMFHPQNI